MVQKKEKNNVVEFSSRDHDDNVRPLSVSVVWKPGDPIKGSTTEATKQRK